jgi:hypothetical protein
MDIAVSEHQDQERVPGVDAALWNAGNRRRAEDDPAARRCGYVDRVLPPSPLLVALAYRQWHCPGCDRALDTWKVVACPHCEDTLAVPF